GVGDTESALLQQFPGYVECGIVGPAYGGTPLGLAHAGDEGISHVEEGARVHESRGTRSSRNVHVKYFGQHRLSSRFQPWTASTKLGMSRSGTSTSKMMCRSSRISGSSAT